jgi:prolyl-tRNA editing enzyme YbaK/EbsC (Cys-tRNA(Pro) deacylase)
MSYDLNGICTTELAAYTSFGTKNPIDTYLDDSLKAYDIVYPAAGEINAAVKLTVKEIVELTGGKWVDISN